MGNGWRKKNFISLLKRILDTLPSEKMSLETWISSKMQKSRKDRDGYFPVFHIAVLKNATSILGVGLVEDNRFSSVLKVHFQRTVWQEW